MSKIRIQSVTFFQSVRLPGTNTTANYIPGSDYPMTYDDARMIIEARLPKDRRPISDNEPIRWYGLPNVKEMTPVAADLAPETNVMTNEQGHLVIPTAPLKSLPNGTFERVTEEPVAAAAPPPPPPETPSETPRAKRKPGPKPRNQAEAAKQAAAPAIAHPNVRVQNGPQGGA